MDSMKMSSHPGRLAHDWLVKHGKEYLYRTVSLSEWTVCLTWFTVLT